jgi:hypothetical protein
MIAPDFLWERPTEEVEAFKKAIGLTVDADESTDEIKFSVETLKGHKFKLFENSEATQLDDLHAAFEALMNKYGPALTLQLKFAADELSNRDYTREKLEAFCKAVEGFPITLYLNLDKTKLAAHWKLTSPSANLKLFFSSSALVRALNQPLSDLEKENGLLRDFTGEKKLILLVVDHEINLNGEYLSILGGTAAGKWQSYLWSSNPNEAAQKLGFVHAEATAKLKWDEIQLSHVTPLQLLVSWEKNDTGIAPPSNSDKIAQALYSQLITCSLLYLATSSKLIAWTKAGAAPRTGRNLLFTFSEDKYLAWIRIGPNEETGETLVKANQKNPWEASLTIGKLAEWVYKEERGIAVRRALSQAVIAASLQDSKPPDGLAELIKRAPEIKDRVLARWDAFMDERLKEYFTNVKALEEVVESTSKGYSDQVQSLTKTLTENMLAAVAVVVGSFLVAIFKAPFERKIFVFGTTAYTVYLAIFPVLIGLVSAWQQYQKSKDSFEKRKRDFGGRLTDVEVNAIVGGVVRSRERWFENWFVVTILTYLVAIMLMVIAISTVPSLIKRWADDFTLTSTSYGKPVNGQTVPVEIHGENFDKDKQILVSIAGSQFSNTGEPPVTVHGFTVLRVVPTRQDLEAAITQNNRQVKVRQGTAESLTQLPQDPLPASPNPAVVNHWDWVGNENDGVATAKGSQFDSIIKVTVNGVPCRFKTSDDGKQIELYGFRKASLSNANATFNLTDGRQTTALIVFSR